MSNPVKVVGAPTSYKASLKYSSATTQRIRAVEVALELIHADLSGKGSYSLEQHMELLSSHADKIQAALPQTD